MGLMVYHHILKKNNFWRKYKLLLKESGVLVRTRCVCKKFGESYQKTNKTKYTNKFSLLPFKIVAICYNTRLTTFIQLPETISNGLLWNRSQNSCHMIFDGIHVRKTCTSDGCLQARKQEEVHRSQIRGM